MPVYEDVPFELKHYATPRTMAVGVTDRRTGADTLLILSGTVVLPPEMGRTCGSDRVVERKRIRFGLPQSPKVVTARSQVRGLQVVTGLASFVTPPGAGERALAIDQSLLEWADDLGELRATIDIAYLGVGSTISRVMYNAFVLAHAG